jgi:hypothetical protein
MNEAKDQHLVGTPEKPRGQEMGLPEENDKNQKADAETPAINGDQSAGNEMSADRSNRNVGSDSVTPSTTTPSVPAAMPSENQSNQGGEKEFFNRNKGE